MLRDKVMDGKTSFCAFVKNDIRDMAEDFFKQVRTTECTEEMYEDNYNKSLDLNMKKIAIQYSSKRDRLAMTPFSTFGESKPFQYIHVLGFSVSVMFNKHLLFQVQGGTY